ncbi:MAG: Cytochrome biosis protein transrane region [Anaerospora sp.]|nr:Cytochrome biosis protein transrane region [Anaerospora sp.]
MSSVELLFGTLAGGVLSFFSPCIFPLLPVYLGYLSGEDELLSMQDVDRTANKQAQRKRQ